RLRRAASRFGSDDRRDHRLLRRRRSPPLGARRLRHRAARRGAEGSILPPRPYAAPRRRRRGRARELLSLAAAAQGAGRVDPLGCSRAHAAVTSRVPSCTSCPWSTSRANRGVPPPGLSAATFAIRSGVGGKSAPVPVAATRRSLLSSPVTSGNSPCARAVT